MSKITVQNMEKFKVLGSGQAEIIASGSAISYKGAEVWVYVTPLDFTFIVATSENDKYPSQIRYNPPNEVGHYFICFDNFKRLGFSGTPEPMRLATTDFTDKDGNTSKRYIEVSLRITFLAEQDDFLLHYTVYVVPA